MVYGMRGCRVEPPGCAVTEQRGAWHQRMPSRRLPRGHLLGRSWREAYHHHRFAQLLHALDHVRGACRLAVPARDEDIAGLGHLVIAPHACGLPEAFPFRAEELMPDLVLPGPAVAELIRAPGPAREDLRNAVAIRRQHLAELLVVGERPFATCKSLLWLFHSSTRRRRNLLCHQQYPTESCGWGNLAV